MSNIPQIPGADLPLGTPGATDTVVGVDQTSGALRRFRRDSFPLSAADQARLRALEAGQSSDMLGFTTKALMDASLSHSPNTLAVVTNDGTAANNGTYIKLGASGAGSWQLSSDRVTGLEGRVTAAENALEPIDAAIDGAINDEFLWGIVDSLGKLGLALRSDGTLQARFRELLFQGGEIDPTFSTLEGDLFALVDSAGRMAMQVTSDGTLKAKVTTPETIAARGSRATLDARLSQHTTAYGLPKGHVWGEWHLRETRQRLRKRLLGESAQLVVASIGDSWTHWDARWCGPTASTLKTTYGDAGAGYVSFARSGATGNGNVLGLSVVTYTGTWDTSIYHTAYSPDLGQAASSTVGARFSYAIGASPSSVKLYAKGGAGVVQYRYNGGAWAQVDLSALAIGMQVVTLAAPSAGVFDIEVVSGAPVLFGIDVQKSTDGVSWHKLGATGSNTNHWASVDATNWKSGLTALAPNLVTIMLGTNDQGGYDATTYKGYMQTVITRVREALPLADVLLIAPCENGSASAAIRPMAAYASALYELAATNRCAFLDLQYVFGDSFSEYASTSPRAWFNADTIHPEPTTGGRAIVDAVIRLLNQL